jgi:hypothetical protein
MAIVVIPTERKCLTDGLVALPSAAVVAASGALVVPPPLVCTIGCTVIPVTVMSMPAVFALVCIAATSLVVFMDELVRTGLLCPAGNVTVNLAMTLPAKRRAMTDRRRPAATVTSVTLT